MTHRSIRSSVVQVRTKPALRLCQGSFQKVVCDFLKSKQIPQIIEHGLRSNGKGALTNRPFYGWRRSSHLRSAFLYMESGKPVVLIPPHADEKTKTWTIRIPINHRELETVGPVICECYWDNVDHELIISDVIYYNKEVVWQTKGFTERYDIMHNIIQRITQNTDEYSDCTIVLPHYESLESVSKWNDIDSDKAYCVSFQPEDAGARRFRYVVGANQSEKKPYEKREPSRFNTNKALEIQSDEEEAVAVAVAVPEKIYTYTNPLLPAPTPIVHNTAHTPTHMPTTANIVKEGSQICTLTLDTKNPLPDVYKLQGESGKKDMGVAAVRSLDLSIQLRSIMKNKQSLRVQVTWYNPFKKWEVVNILDSLV